MGSRKPGAIRHRAIVILLQHKEFESCLELMEEGARPGHYEGTALIFLNYLRRRFLAPVGAVKIVVETDKGQVEFGRGRELVGVVKIESEIPDVGDQILHVLDLQPEAVHPGILYRIEREIEEP